jgi:hypothetical protein
MEVLYAKKTFDNEPEHEPMERILYYELINRASDAAFGAAFGVAK